MPLRSFFRFLALLLGIFYLDTVCQTDAEDARAYYAQGLPEYVAAAQPVALVAPVRRCTVPVRRPVGIPAPVGRWQRGQMAQAVACPPTPVPWPRRWLRCGVIQV